MPNNQLIYLCDLTHTSQGYATELTPYPVGCIKAWLLRYSNYAGQLQAEIFKDPQLFIDAFLDHQPAVAAFSNYMWNLDLSYSIAKEVKAAYPETFIIFGGPNYPLEDTVRERWLKARPAVDMYITGEGEEPFTNVIDAWKESGDWDKVRRLGIEGCHTLIDGNFFKTSEVSPRVRDLDMIPSPYLEGYLDEFLIQVPMTPLVETNRGCPFTCTFCVDGIAERTKVYRKSMDRFDEELEYIAQRYKGTLLTIADTNFGMFAQDIEAAKAIARIKTKYHYPSHIVASTGKNQKERVLECAEILEGSLRLAASVQSLDPVVLKNVKRQNISAQKLIEVTKISNRLDANTYSEVILAMPGDTREKHFDTVLQLADSDLKLIPMFTLIILDGSELGTDASREKWTMQTKFRVVPRCFGAYDFQGNEVLSADVEEVCVATDSLSLEDYYECRSFALTMGVFYQDRIMYELYRFLNNFSIKPSDILPVLHERRLGFSKGITDLFESYDEATRTELWDTREELEAYTKSDRSIIDKYVSGELGNNVLYRHRALALLELMDELHEAAFDVASQLLRSKDEAAYQLYLPYLDELKLYSLSRKRNVFDLDLRYIHEFTYDFRALLDQDFEGLPQKLDEPLAIGFAPTDDQKTLLKDQMYVQGSDLNGLAKLMSRTPGSKLQRSLFFDDSVDAQGVYTSQQFTTPTLVTPGEFS